MFHHTLVDFAGVWSLLFCEVMVSQSMAIQISCSFYKPRARDNELIEYIYSLFADV